MHVAVELFQQVAVLARQLLLVGQGDHLPVGFVRAEDNGLLVGAELFARQGFGVARNAVVGADLASHVERLGEHDGPYGEVARVRMEGVDEAVPHPVDGFAELGQVGARRLDQRG